MVCMPPPFGKKPGRFAMASRRVLLPALYNTKIVVQSCLQTDAVANKTFARHIPALLKQQSEVAARGFV